MTKEVKTAVRYFIIMFGLFIMANGIAFMVNANLGVNPWHVFHIGLAYKTGLSFGRVLQLVGLAIVLISWIFHVKPSFVTILNMYFIGYFVDWINVMQYVPQPQARALRLLYFTVGLVIYGQGTALYMSGNRGAGPRDNLMMALTRITSQRISVVRGFMEVTVATVGYFLGGPLGVGTVIAALFIGVFVESGFVLIKKAKQSPLLQPLLVEKVKTVQTN